jgi:O-antigen ligase
MESGVQSATQPRAASRIGAATSPATSESAAPDSLDAGIVILAALLFLTEAFGREFSTVGLESIPLYVTEVALLGALGATLWRVRHRFVELLLVERAAIVMVVVYWFAGALAALRGVVDYGVDLTLEDIGLLEFSILLPLVILTVGGSERRSDLLTRVIAFGGIATIFVFGASDLTARTWGDALTLVQWQGIAAGTYLCFYVAWVAAQVVNGITVSRLHWVLAPVAIVLVGMTDQRSVWVALAATLLLVAVTAPTQRLKLVGSGCAVLAIVLCLGGGLVVEAALGPRNAGDQDDDLQIQRELAAFGGGEGEEGENVSWRLDFWSELIDRSASTPVLGVGFGEPAAFAWGDKEYDFRRPAEGDAGVTGPHNGFVDVLYRMGVLALAALVGLIALVLWRLRDLLPANPELRHARARYVALAGMLVAALAMSGFTDALRGPYLGMFPWAIVGLMLADWHVTKRRLDSPAEG